MSDMYLRHTKKNPFKLYKGKYDRDMRDRYKKNPHRPNGKRQSQSQGEINA